MKLTPYLFASCLMFATGCGLRFVEQTKPTPVVIEEVESNAGDCLKCYGQGVASAFEQSAAQFRKHEPSAVILKDMGDALVPARVKSFLPLMQKLNGLRPAAGATTEQRYAADEARAVALEQWAKELRGEK